MLPVVTTRRRFLSRGLAGLGVVGSLGSRSGLVWGQTALAVPSIGSMIDRAIKFLRPRQLSRYNESRPTWIRELTRERIAHAACCHNPPPVSEPRSRRSGRGGLSGLAVGPGLGTDGIGRTLDRVQ